MGTSTRKIKKSSSTRTSTRIRSSNQPQGRRGGATRSIHAEEIKVPSASMLRRFQSMLIDIALIVLVSEFLYYREAFNIFNAQAGTFTAVSVIYFTVYIFIYIFPMRFFGQTLGMKFLGLKILHKDSLDFVKLSNILQRQSVGYLLNITAGAYTLAKDKALQSDEVFKTIVVRVQKDEEKE